MKEYQLKEGDRIIGTGNQTGVDLTGRIGTVVLSPSDADFSYGIRFDKKHPNFHVLDGRCKKGEGYWVERDVMEPFFGDFENE